MSKAKGKSYNQIRYTIDTESSKISKPLIIDQRVSAVIRQYDLSPVVVNKLLQKINATRSKKLKRVYNKQAIHLISLQAVNALKAQAIARFKNLLDLNMLLIPFKIGELSATDGGSTHEFSLVQKDNELLQLVEELPDSKQLISHKEIGVEEDLDEILQKYDYLVSQLKKNITQYQLFSKRLDKYKEFYEKLVVKLDPKLIQKNLVLSSNTKIIEQINKSRILIEKVGQKLA